jgi:hypothetical protein
MSSSIRNRVSSRPDLEALVFRLGLHPANPAPKAAIASERPNITWENDWNLTTSEA